MLTKNLFEIEYAKIKNFKYNAYALKIFGQGEYTPYADRYRIKISFIATENLELYKTLYKYSLDKIKLDLIEVRFYSITGDLLSTDKYHDLTVLSISDLTFSWDSKQDILTFDVLFKHKP